MVFLIKQIRIDVNQQIHKKVHNISVCFPLKTENPDTNCSDS